MDEQIEHHHHHYHIPIPHLGITPLLILVFNIIHTFVWMIVLPISLLTGLKNSVPFLVGISVWALVMSGISSVVAAYGIYRVTKEVKKVAEN